MFYSEKEFKKNISLAYDSLKNRLDESWQNAEKALKGSSYWRDSRVWIVRKLGEFFGLFDQNRQVVSLGNGYVLKCHLKETIGDDKFDYYWANPDNHTEERRPDEKNASFLVEKGFTREKGFYVPYHKDVGVEIVDGKANLDLMGSYWTITEDLSEGGEYQVTDVFPHHFATLRNREDFTASYLRHMDSLTELCNLPNVSATILNHGTPRHLPTPLSRMLLLKEKENYGQIVIGDLDHLVFKEIPK